MKLYSVEELQNLLKAELEKQAAVLEKSEPAGLYAPVNYSLEMGGKRVRPILLLLAFNLFSDEMENALPAALAIEVFHNFTLLHDDIMDKAEVRRNRPTVHKKFGENGAILSGDVMAFLAYKSLLKSKTQSLSELIGLFTNTAIEVCEGQQMDMDFENRMQVTEEEYIEMIRLKTAVLLACSLKAGALVANAGKEVADQLYEFGINLGLAFQLQDDLLDTFGDQKIFGKKIGGDIIANKKTYLLIKALQNASDDQKTELESWLLKTEFDATKKIDAVTSVYNQLNIKLLTQQKIDYHFEKCTLLLNRFQVDSERKKQLEIISNNMLNRMF